MTAERISKITLTANAPEQYQKLKQVLLNTDEVIDFNIIFPEPKSLDLAISRTSSEFIWLYLLNRYIACLMSARDRGNNNLWKRVYQECDDICAIIANVQRKNWVINNDTTEKARSDLIQLVNCKQQWLAYDPTNDTDAQLKRAKKAFNLKANAIMDDTAANHLSVNEHLLQLISNPHNPPTGSLKEFISDRLLLPNHLPLSYPGRILASVGEMYLVNYHDRGFRDSCSWRRHYWGGLSVSNGHIKDADLRIIFHITDSLSPVFANKLAEIVGHGLSISEQDIYTGISKTTIR